MTMTYESLNTSNAEEKLSRMISLHLGVEIEPSKLRDFLKGHWERLSILAHAVHEQPHIIRNRSAEWSRELRAGVARAHRA